jgi:signal peptidase II
MLILMAVALVIGAIVAVRRVRLQGAPAWAAGLIIGGAAANLLDRAVHGAVQDFIVIGPVVVNLADLAVLVGLAGIVAGAATRFWSGWCAGRTGSRRIG